jgi:broad specificity phosphatase PhoE
MLYMPKETDVSFIQKLSNFLEQLPPKSLIVTHGTCVMTLVELALGAKIEKIPEWDGSIKNASISMVTGGTLQHLSKVVW